ncbi:MAG: hypothetical protein M9928_14540 [Anaerolineae bacterium]|nr:hypothetical protein [Anaerolineae bacterium]
MVETRSITVTVTFIALVGWLPLVACTPTAPAPGTCLPFPGAVAATATRPGSTPATPPTGSTPPVVGSLFCPPPVVTPLPTATPNPPATADGIRWQVGQVNNLTVTPGDEQLVTAVAGDGQSAVVWRSGPALHIAESDAGRPDYYITSTLTGVDADIAYDAQGRLHLVYQLPSGELRYRHSVDNRPLDQSSSSESTLGFGSAPQVKVDRDGFATVIHTDTALALREHVQTPGGWVSHIVMPGTQAHLAYAGPESDVFVLAVQQTPTQVAVLKKIGGGGTWILRAVLTSPASISSRPRIDMHARSAALAWITHAPAATDPTQLAREATLAAETTWPQATGAAQRVTLADGRFETTLLTQATTAISQTVSVTVQGRGISVDASCGVVPPGTSCAPADMRMRVGIDPNGGNDPAAVSVVWSPAQSPTAGYVPLTVSTTALTTTVTVFLQADPDTAKAENTALWDSVTVSGAVLMGTTTFDSFVLYGGNPSQEIGTGWTPLHRVESVTPGAGDVYAVLGSVSADNGSTWSNPLIVSRNDVAGRITGAYADAVYPVVASGQDAVLFVTLYEEGDPTLANPGLLRLGRPTLVACRSDLADCTGAPGDLVIARSSIRPATAVAAECGATYHHYCTLMWSAWQPDMAGQEIYATVLTMKEEG